LFFDILIFVFAIIWALYFSKARRVRLVFIEKNWTYTPHSERRNLTTEDKKKLRRRAAIAALIAFVLFLLMMGSVLKNEGKQPDVGIFYLPLFYAVIAAVVAWYLPLRNNKKSSTENSETGTVSNQK
jgi:accessory gene regulator protein AgrB